MHGSFPTLQLERGALRLEVVPGLGARVVSLQDRRTNREWLVQGHPPAGEEEQDAWAAEDAVFGGEQAYGWDECLPTVGSCADPVDPTAPDLRDHGDQWGRAAEASSDGSAVVASWPAGRWGVQLHRRLRLDGGAVLADYVAVNPNARPVPFLWSSHALLALEPGTRLHLPRLQSVRIAAAHGVALPGGTASWPRAALRDGTNMSLDIVAGVDAGRSVKAFAVGLEGRAAVQTPTGAWLGIAWDPGFAPVLGVWLDDGGWPLGDPRQQVALEPTTAAADALTAVLTGGSAATIPPRGEVRWWMRMEIGLEARGLGAFLRG